MNFTKKRGRNDDDSSFWTKADMSDDSTPRSGALRISFDQLVTPDFEELASQFPDFRKAWKVVQETRQAKHGGGTTSLAAATTQSFSAALSKALLRLHFNISLPNIPEHHLCPPIPNRYFYVRWAQIELLPLLLPLPSLQQTAVSAGNEYFSDLPLQPSGCMLDIGTGAACIYPLLWAATASPSSLKAVFATDIDPESLHLAKLNVQGNPSLASKIHILSVQSSSTQAGNKNTQQHCGPLRASLERISDCTTRIDLCMTNPPFYDDATPFPERFDGRPRTAMTVSEGTYPGGEIGFLLDMVCDGLVLYGAQQSTVGWCTSMCGKKSSWTMVKAGLEQLLGYAHVQGTEFGPGHMTRWFLAWTFHRPQMRSPLCRHDSWSFTVELNSEEDWLPGSSIKPALHCVSSRLQMYCQETVQGRRLVIDWNQCHSTVVQDQQHQRLAVIQSHPEDDNYTASASWLGDESLPDQFQQLLQSRLNPVSRRALLPPEGQFQVDVMLQLTSHTVVRVNATAYSHTRYGKLTVDKLKQQMQGEVCRTTRRWRRKKKQNAPENTEPMNVSE